MTENIPWYMVSKKVLPIRAIIGDLGESAAAKVFAPFCKKHGLSYERNVPTGKTDGDKDHVIASNNGDCAIIEGKNWVEYFYFSQKKAITEVNKFNEADPLNICLRILTITKLNASFKTRSLLIANRILVVETGKQILPKPTETICERKNNKYKTIGKTKIKRAEKTCEQKLKKRLLPLLVSFFTTEQNPTTEKKGAAKVFLIINRNVGILNRISINYVKVSSFSDFVLGKINKGSMLNNSHSSDNPSNLCLSPHYLSRLSYFRVNTRSRQFISSSSGISSIENRMNHSRF